MALQILIGVGVKCRHLLGKEGFSMFSNFFYNFLII